jgi:Na+/H+-dicarboxylate symporter
MKETFMITILKRYSTSFILLSVFAALLLGVLIPELFVSISFFGDLFINLLKLFALPLISSALLASLGEMGGNQLTGFKNLARNAVGYMLVSEIIAVAIALLLFNVFKPGLGLDPSLILQGKAFIPAHEHDLHISNFIVSIVPHNIFEALAKFDLLPVVFFSIMFGIACNKIGDKAKPMVKLAVSIREISSTCLHGVMLLAPFGIFALVGAGVAQSHLNGNLQANLLALLNFVLVLMLGLFLHSLWQFMVMKTLTKQKSLDILKKSIAVFSTAFGTSSSVASLPIAMETADQLKSKPAVTRFMLPLTASINVGGMMMYEVAAALFFSQMLGFDLPLEKQLLVAIACILGGIAEGGIPESSMVSLVVVFKIVNVPISAISILLPLDRIIDRIRTVVNIFGNMCGVIIVSHLTPNIEIKKNI